MAQDLMTGSFGQIGMLDLLREDSMDEENMGDRLVVNNSKKKLFLNLIQAAVLN